PAEAEYERQIGSFRKGMRTTASVSSG
ncbi:cyclic nucleotide-binding protein, partial [Escherichia coli]